MQAATCIGGIDERSLLDVVLVCPIAHKTTQEFTMGTDPPIQKKRSLFRVQDFLLLDATPLIMELETAGGVMTKLTER